MIRRTGEDIGGDEERAARAAVAAAAISEPLLLMAISALHIPDAELASMLGIAPANVYQWRTGRAPVPRRHQPAIAALLVITWSKSFAQSQVVGAGPDVLEGFEAMRRLLVDAVRPVLRDPDLRKKYERLIKRMLKALRSAAGQRVMAGEVENLVGQLIKDGKAN